MFHFQQFSVAQDQCAMKVSTDSLLLGAWTRYFDAQPILDIGTGTAILALIAAQFNPLAAIHGVEIDPASAQQAQQNVHNSPFQSRITILNQSIQSLALLPQYQQYFHSIVSNPPYYDPQKFLSPDTPQRQLARSTHQLPHAELLQVAKMLLAPQGRFSLIIPFDAKTDFFKLASQTGFYLSRQTIVAYTAAKQPARLLLELTLRLTTPIFANLSVYQAHSSLYTPEYAQLCKDLYLPKS
jgi:tRNA1Val (adenine37-N6)-methyltransferase